MLCKNPIHSGHDMTQLDTNATLVHNPDICHGDGVNTVGTKLYKKSDHYTTI